MCVCLCVCVGGGGGYGGKEGREYTTTAAQKCNIEQTDRMQKWLDKGKGWADKILKNT